MKRLPFAIIFVFIFLCLLVFITARTNNVFAATKTLTATADSPIKSDYPDTNHGGVNWLSASRLWLPQTPKKIRFLVKFGLGSIPSNATVTSATFSIYFLGCGESFSQDIDDLNIARVTASWTESGVTWNTHKDKFDMSGALYYSAPCDSINKYLNYNAKTFVQNWLNGSQPNYGLGIYGDEGAGVSWIKRFRSKENGANKPPKLSITYTVPSGTANGDGTDSDETSDTRDDDDSSKPDGDKVATDSATISAQKATPSTTIADKAKGTSGWKIALLAVLIVLLAGAIAGYIIYRRRKKQTSKKDGEPEKPEEKPLPQPQIEEKEEINPQGLDNK